MQVRSKETPESLVVKPSCVVERPGAEQGGSDWPVRSTCEACASVVKCHHLRVVKWVPSRFRDGEGHGRHLGFGSGCRGTHRRKGRGTVRWLSWELGRPSSAPSLRVTGSMPSYNQLGWEGAGGREGVGGGRSSDDGQDNTTCLERRTPASSMHDDVGRDAGECRDVG